MEEDKLFRTAAVAVWAVMLLVAAAIGSFAGWVVFMLVGSG